MSVIEYGNVAFLEESGAAVWFSNTKYTAFNKSAAKTKEEKGTQTRIQELTSKLQVAYWGEDNKFPQSVSNQMDYCGVVAPALDFKAKALYGNGILWGKVVGYEKNEEVFEIAQPGAYPDVEAFFKENNGLYRFFMEFLQDWTTFNNCFPELVLSKDGKKIKKLIHQESCDARFKQMETDGKLKYVYLSKLWGDAQDQYVKFNKDAALKASIKSQKLPEMVDNEWVKQLRAIDIYNPFEDLKEAVEREKHRNVILPVNYPSVNKTYYQKAFWDGARIAGWWEIAAKIPAMLKALYAKAFNIKYHIEIPEKYWEKRFGIEKWIEFTPAEKEEHRRNLLGQMNTFLAGSDNAFKTFVSYFDIDQFKGEEVGRIKITVIENKSTLDKDLLASSAANSEILFSMQINPDLIGAGAPGGPYSGSAGSGSNIREAYLVYCAQLHLERQIILEPLRLIQQYNGWDENLQFRFKDVVLTTLDKGKGTEKKVS